MSLSARRAWIEIGIWLTKPRSTAVALRKESVDRNSDCRVFADVVAEVALRKESVDRNQQAADITQKVHNVALRKESVDRN